MVADAISVLMGSRKGLRESVTAKLEIPKVLFGIYGMPTDRVLNM
jgi:hypothetical protein